MKKNLLTYCMIAVAATAIPATAANEIFLVKKDGSGVVSHYFYNADNQISRANDVDAGGITPLYKYFYNYTDGLLSEDYYTQWKDMGTWTDPRDHKVYTYDEQGRLASAENTMTNRIQYYYYNEDGYLYQVVDMGKNYGSTEYDKTYSTATYLDFDANGNPAKLEHEDGLYASGNYDETYTYDEQGRVTCKEAYRLDGTPKHKYEYTYDENGVTTGSYKYMNNGEGGFEYQSRTTRTLIGDNTYECKYDEYWSEWINHDSYTEYYSTLKSDLAPTNLILTDITTTDAPNAIELKCDAPATELPGAQYIVWRDWQAVDTVAAVDGVITYTEVNVGNDVEEYFIQTYDATNNILYNISNVVPVEFTTELPAVAELRYIKTTEGESIDGQGTTMPAYWVHFEWDAPETDLEILGYNIYDVLSFGEGFDPYYIFLKETQSTADSVSVFRERDFNSPDQQKSVTTMVTVLYVLGESDGVVETFPIEKSDIQGTKVENLAYVAGNNLVMAENAHVAIYNAAGALVNSLNNVAQVELNALPTGTYIAVVKIGENTQTFKIARR